ncbi:MAG: YCF48-related protein [Saprospiraceae bacterium]|nr:YCF48-related protein [Saprospiraceae bacterium]
MIRSITFLCFFILLLLNSARAQNTENLFSIPGLKYIIDTHDDIGIFSDGSLFYQGTVGQDTVYHNFVAKKIGPPVLLYIDGYKVYKKNYSSNPPLTLLYDFEMEEGDSLYMETYNQVFILEEKKIIQLEDGLDRIEQLLYDVSNPDKKLSIIEGIGNRFSAIQTNTIFTSSSLQCVTSDASHILINDDFTLEECEARSCFPLTTFFVVEGEDENIDLTHFTFNYDSVSMTFGDGVYFDELIESYTFQETGCYKIEIEAYNECGETSYHSVYYKNCNDSLWVKNNDLKLNKIHFLDDNIGFGITRASAFKTLNGGISWIELAIPDTLSNFDIYSIHFIDELNGVILAANTKEVIFKTADGGLNWDHIFTDNRNFCEAYLTNDNIIFAIGEGIISRSTDNGLSWLDLDLPFGIHHIEFHLTSQNELAVSYPQPTSDGLKPFLFLSEDNGETWTTTPLDFIDFLSDLHFFDTQTGIVSGNKNIYKTTDGGESWITLFNPKENGYIQHIEFTDEMNGAFVIEDKIYSTENGGMSWQVEFCNNTENIRDMVRINQSSFSALDIGFYQRSEPADFDCMTFTKTKDLIENSLIVAPNPVLSQFSVLGTLDKSFSVEIRDMNGQLLWQERNQYQTTFDISELPSGIFILSIRIDEKNQSFKLVKL